MNLGTKLFLSALLLAVGVYGGYTGVRLMNQPNAYADVKSELKLKPVRSLDGFEYTERSGKSVKFADLKGEIFVVNFFFANCPMSCLQFTRTIAALQDELSRDLDVGGVRFLSITVDPSNDTPERLQKYADSFSADPERWWFLTGPLGETQELGRTLHVSVLGTSHTDEMVLVDRTGTIRGAYDHKDPAKVAKFKNDLKALLAEQPRKNDA